MEEGMELNSIVNYYRAVASLENKEGLEAKTMYRLGKVSDITVKSTKNFYRVRDQKQKEVSNKVVILQKEYSSTTDDTRKIEINEEITNLNTGFNKDMEDLLSNKETLSKSLPKFKLLEFTAQEDNKDKSIKKGQCLVHQGFITLMMDLIEEE